MGLFLSSADCYRDDSATRQTGIPTIPFYLTPKQDDFNKIPELQICIAEALYDIESILSDPGGYPYKEVVKLRDQIVSKLERAWEITGRTEDELTGVMLQISQVVAQQFNEQE